MSDFTRAVRRDNTGLLRAVVTLVRDFILAQLLGGHSRADTDALIARAQALKVEADSDGDGIPDSQDPTPHGEATTPAAPTLLERIASANAELAALSDAERADIFRQLASAETKAPGQ